MDLGTGKVASKAKSPTTYADLRIGITNAMKGAMRGIVGPEEVVAVSLSTTLATNALIEGRGGRVASLLIGIEPDRPLPSEINRLVRGGHTMATDGGIVEIESLDEDAVRRFCDEIRGQVSAVAVTESFGTLCPDHELRAKEIIREATGLPVTCGHELTAQLGFYERAVTAALNSRLVSVLSSFIRAVEEELDHRGIHAPVSMVKSDGTITTSTVVKERPVETIMTGPAASVIGARYLTGLDDIVVVDQGGTTCLTSILRGGWPNLDERGATIASYRTRIMALRIRAIGLGGDSHIRVADGRIEIGPRRLRPLCLASAIDPRVKEKIRETGETILFACTDQWQSARGPDVGFMRALKDIEPATLKEFVNRTGIAVGSAESILRALSNSRSVEEIGLTITDILHWKAVYLAHDREAAQLGVAFAAKRSGMSEQAFVDEVERIVIDTMCKEVALAYLEELGELSPGQDYALDALLNGYDKEVHIELFAKRPLVAAGACSYAFLPTVAERLHTEVVMPMHADVCNATGCIVGAVLERSTVSIRKSFSAAPSYGSSGGGGFQVLSSGHTESCASKEEAIERAKSLAAEGAREKAIRSGATDISVTLKVKEHSLPVREDWTGGATEPIWVSAEVVATAIGRPSYWKKSRE
jgi:N-methylhydantoinase A/oxoprolinase/acetone carboxylase beta subunit